MALMFQRLARNFIKNGYFPTDAVTMERVINMLSTSAKQIRMIDPCCGEGTALAELHNHFKQNGVSVESLGIEFDAERAWHAKSILSTVIHSDMQDVHLSQRSCGLLFLNPPYGHVVGDQAALGDRHKADRLEKIFFRSNLSALTFGGVLVLIVPYYVLDQEFSQMIARNFDGVVVYKAPEQRFKQAVIIGTKKRSEQPDPVTVKCLMSAQDGEIPEMPESYSGPKWDIPEVKPNEQFSFTALRIDQPQLEEQMNRLHNASLWPRFNLMFNGHQQEVRRPLRDLSNWHLALALAAGQINGLVSGKNGQHFLIKGDTFKSKSIKSEFRDDGNGSVTEVRIATDTFVPTIRAIDFTPGPTLGDCITIQ